MNIKLTHSGGYDPALGKSHPDHQDQTSPFRVIAIECVQGRVRLEENDDDDSTYLTADPRRAPRSQAQGVTLSPQQLWDLGCQIVGWFGGTVLNCDEARTKRDDVRAKIESVLEQNEARCLDDDIDRGVVVRELLKALAP